MFFWEKKTDGDVKIMNLLNLDPFCDVIIPQFYPKCPNFNYKFHFSHKTVKTLADVINVDYMQNRFIVVCVIPITLEVILVESVLLYLHFVDPCS